MKNRITPYAGGWLTFLIRQGVCTEQQAREAQARVAQAAIEAVERLRDRKRRKRQEPE